MLSISRFPDYRKKNFFASHNIFDYVGERIRGRGGGSAIRSNAAIRACGILAAWRGSVAVTGIMFI